MQQMLGKNENKKTIASFEVGQKTATPCVVFESGAASAFQMVEFKCGHEFVEIRREMQTDRERDVEL